VGLRCGVLSPVLLAERILGDDRVEGVESSAQSVHVRAAAAADAFVGFVGAGPAASLQEMLGEARPFHEGMIHRLAQRHGPAG